MRVAYVVQLEDKVMITIFENGVEVNQYVLTLEEEAQVTEILQDEGIGLTYWSI